MKKYIVIGQIHGIGGWQTYMNKKIEYMKSFGWKTYALGIFTAKPEKNDCLTELIDFKYNTFLDLAYLPAVIGQRRRKQTIERIMRIIEYTPNDEVVFEATTEELLVWGEMFAEYFGGKSICVNVKNNFPEHTVAFYSYLLFKKQRGEITVVNRDAFKEMFKGYADFPVSDDHVVSPLTYNMFYEDQVDYAEKYRFDQYDYVIGTVGWLDKEYYLEVCSQTTQFAKRHKDKKIVFVVIGSSSKGDIELSFTRETKSAKNLRLLLLGSMTPLPANLIRLFDVCIASYGSAIISDKIGVKTIMMYDHDIIPLGIMGYTLREWPYVINRANTKETVSQMLDDVLIDEICSKYEYSPSDYGVDKVEIQKHISYYENSDMSKEYYDIFRINELSNQTHRMRQIHTLSSVIGIGGVEWLMKLKAKVVDFL